MIRREDCYLSKEDIAHNRLYKKAEKQTQTILGHTIYEGGGTTTKTWVSDYSPDFEIYIKQTSVGKNPKISFGPVTTALNSLFYDGHWIEAMVTQKNVKGNNPVRVYLTDGTNRYKLYSIPFEELQIIGKANGRYDFADTPKMVGRNLLRTHSLVADATPTHFSGKVEIVKVDRDPFDILSERYPRKPARKLTMNTMVGNRTLGERLKETLSDRTHLTP